MNFEQAKQKILKYHWEPWLQRPWYGFLISTFVGGNTKSAFKKIGLKGWECDILFTNNEWYKSKKAFQKAGPKVLAWLKKHSVSEITNQLEQAHNIWLSEVIQMTKAPDQDLPIKLKRFAKILRQNVAYIWATHLLEFYFTPLLEKEVAKYIKTDVHKFIGDAAFPIKPNKLEEMIKEYKKGVSPKILAKQYGWMRARDGFSRPYNAAEIKDIAENALKHPKHRHPRIPKPLEQIFTEARTLVYYRTLRTDVFYELVYRAKPLFKAAAKKYKIPFKDIKFYTLQSLIEGKPEKKGGNFSIISVGGKTQVYDGSLLANLQNTAFTEIKGTIAQPGKISGRAKILMKVSEMGKIKKGDILVTYMTSPNFLPAMKLAAGFVTDEGGLTCHAAIVAREMKKPCVIGTRIATKVFKDGDMVEVNANKGIVKKLS